MSCIKKEVIEITDCVWINSTDVSSMEYADYGNYFGANYGTVITMKSGRKIFVKYKTPKEIYEKLRGENGLD